MTEQRLREALTVEQADDLVLTLVSAHADWFNSFNKALKDGVRHPALDKIPERKKYEAAYEAVVAALAAPIAAAPASEPAPTTRENFETFIRANGGNTARIAVSVTAPYLDEHVQAMWAGWKQCAWSATQASKPAQDGERLLHDKLADALAEIVRLRLRLGDDDPHAPLPGTEK